MPFNIAEFSASISDYGVLQPNKFFVYFSTPRSLYNSVISPTGNILGALSTNYLVQMRAEQARLPGINLITVDNQRYGIGTVQKMPYAVQFTDTSFTFVMDRNALLYQYFYAWMTEIVDFNGAGQVLKSGQRLVSSSPSYLMGYKEGYSTDLNIVIYDNSGNPVKVVTLYEAYPNSMNEIPLDWNNQNSLMKVTMGFTFKEWSMNGVSSVGGALANAIAAAATDVVYSIGDYVFRGGSTVSETGAVSGIGPGTSELY